MPTKLIKTSWNGGLLSQWMDGREDINKYYSGASILTNALVLPHGGFEKRPGTKYIATAPNKCKLFPFEFSVDDALVLEFSNNLLRFYKDGDQVFIPFGTEDLSDFDSATGDSSLLAHWKMNDNLATANVIDGTVAGSHDGTASANTDVFTTTDASGAANTAFDLAGTYDIDVTDHNDFSFGDGTNDSPFSIAAWIRYDDTTADQIIIAKPSEWQLSINSDLAGIAIFDDSTSKAASLSSNITLVTGNWYFIVATYDGRGGSDAADGLEIYINWALSEDSVRTTLSGYVAMENLANNLDIGSNAGANKLEGKLDNVAVFNKELSATEIASLASTASAIPYSITSPYTSSEAFEIHTTQSADVMYIAHKDHHPKKLSRLSDTSWTLMDVPLNNGPFLDENSTSTHLLGFARTGETARDGYYFPVGTAGTLTATNHSPFNSNHVGSLWLLKHDRPDNVLSTPDEVDNTQPDGDGIRIKGDFTFTVKLVTLAKLWRKAGNGEWQEFRSFTAATSFSDTEEEDDVFYTFTTSGPESGVLTAKRQINYGVVKITAVTNSGLASATVVEPVLSDNATDNAVNTSMWAEGAWSDYRGYPRTVTFFEDRLWWASSTNNPDTLWSSKSKRYEDMSFTDEGLDDEAITFPINDNEVSQLQWMFPRQVMAVGAANKEYRFGASDRDKAATPDDSKATPQTSFGSGGIQPKLLNDSIFFFQNAGKKLGSMRFDAVAENFDVDDATLLAYKLFDSAPTTLSVQRVPDSLIWVTRADGVLPTYAHEPKEEISAWSTLLTDNSADVAVPLGLFESTAVIHGSSEDEVWASVKRGSAYYVELFAPRDFGSDISNAFFVDSGITDTSGTTTVSGLDHLEGKEVVVLLDGAVLAEGAGDYTVTAGDITLPSAGTTAQVGLPYTMKARSMRLAIPQEGNTMQSRIKRVSETVVRFIRSLGGKAGVEYGGIEYTQDVGATFSDESQDTPQNYRPAPGGFSEEAYTVITSSDPTPWTTLATIVTAEIEEKR